ncbi:unnamed protein product [Sphagnum balticum]
MDGFKHERTLQKKTQVPECPSEPIDDKPTTNALLVKRRKEERIAFLLLTRNAYLQMEFMCQPDSSHCTFFSSTAAWVYPWNLVM